MDTKKYYIFSDQKLEYIPVYHNRWQLYKKNFPLFIFGIIFCALLFYTSSFFIHTPAERRLLNEKRELLHEFNTLSKKVKRLDSELKILNEKDDSLYRMVLGLKPLPSTIKNAGKGGSEQMHTHSTDWLGQLKKDLDKVQSKAQLQKYSFDKVLTEACRNKNKLQHIPAIMPIYNKDLTGTGSGFGMRLHPILHIKRMHEGMDFYAKKGASVYATADGKVKEARFSTTFGKLIIVDHGYGIETYYAHLSEYAVKKGQQVKRGQVIGLVGNSGLSSGSHLHYEVHVNQKEVNPVYYFYGDLNAAQYEKVVALSEAAEYSMD